MGIVRKDGSGVVIDCVTGRSYSHEGGGRHALWEAGASVRAWPPMIVGTQRALREAGGPLSGCITRGIPRQGGQMVALGCARQENRRESQDHKRNDLDVFVTMMLLEDSPAMLLLGLLREDVGCSCEWKKGRVPIIDKRWKSDKV